MRNLTLLVVMILGYLYPSEDLASSETINSLFHRIWFLKKVQGVEVPTGSFLVFEPQKVTGSTGCNKFWAPVEYKNSRQIDIGPPQSARHYCFRAMSLERAYLAALESIERFDIEENKLIMTMEDGDVFLEFETDYKM